MRQWRGGLGRFGAFRDPAGSKRRDKGTELTVDRRNDSAPDEARSRKTIGEQKRCLWALTGNAGMSVQSGDRAVCTRQGEHHDCHSNGNKHTQRNEGRLERGPESARWRRAARWRGHLTVLPHRPRYDRSLFERSPRLEGGRWPALRGSLLLRGGGVGCVGAQRGCRPLSAGRPLP